jgi:hypothetical protein
VCNIEFMVCCVSVLYTTHGTLYAMCCVSVINASTACTNTNKIPGYHEQDTRHERIAARSGRASRAGLHQVIAYITQQVDNAF